MSASYVLLLTLCLGVVSGLRALTAPAAIAWAAYLGILDLHGSPLAFMGSAIGVGLFTLAAIGEYVNDVLPKTPSRTSPGPLVVRIVMGGLSGACLCAATGQSLGAGAALGAIGGILGAFAGYHARTWLVSSLKVKDLFVAIPEDLVAIGLACLFLAVR